MMGPLMKNTGTVAAVVVVGPRHAATDRPWLTVAMSSGVRLAWP